jgi:hypothetical protein
MRFGESCLRAGGSRSSLSLSGLAVSWFTALRIRQRSFARPGKSRLRAVWVDRLGFERAILWSSSLLPGLSPGAMEASRHPRFAGG